MKFYLSSFKLGDCPEKLAELFSGNKRIAVIPNAMDFVGRSLKIRSGFVEESVNSLKHLGLEPETLELTDYFGKKNALKTELDKFGGVFVLGGNTFVLRQAMKLSGFDELFWELNKREDFVYAGYSAGICVLAKSMESLQIVDDPKDFPYDGVKETIWEGLGYLDYMILPHYKSDHFESEAIDKEVEECEKKGIPYKTLRDGEVIIIDHQS